MNQLHYKLLGLLALALGTLGAFLPLLPTTVFILLAAGCFAKSSPTWHQRLLNNPTFGPIIRHWEINHCIPPKARLLAVTSMGIAGVISFLLLESWFWRIVLITLLALGCCSIFFAHRCTLFKNSSPCEQTIKSAAKKSLNEQP